MAYIDYTLSFLDGKQVNGKAKKIVVKDTLNVMTLATQCAPIIAVLNSGKIEVFDHQNVITEHVYQEGFLNAADNHCTITILKY